MRENAGDKTSAAIIDGYEQKAEGDSPQDLQGIVKKLCAAPVDEVDKMPDAEGERGNDDRRAHARREYGAEQKAAKDQLLKKADEQHASYVAKGVGERHAHAHTKPHVDRGKDQKRKKIQVSGIGGTGVGEAVLPKQSVLMQKNEKSDREKQKKRKRDTAHNTKRERERIRHACADYIKQNEQQRKQERSLVIKLCHRRSSFHESPRCSARMRAAVPTISPQGRFL